MMEPLPPHATDKDRLMRIEVTVGQLHNHLLGNGQPGEIDRIKKRIAALEKFRYLLGGALVAIGWFAHKFKVIAPIVAIIALGLMLALGSRAGSNSGLDLAVQPNTDAGAALSATVMADGSLWIGGKRIVDDDGSLNGSAKRSELNRALRGLAWSALTAAHADDLNDPLYAVRFSVPVPQGER